VSQKSKDVADNDKECYTLYLHTTRYTIERYSIVQAIEYNQNMISAVVLTHNNTDTIDATIRNLLWCDEVICIDDYSRDHTPRVAQKLGAKVYKRHLNGDFAAQRNFGLLQAKGVWVLFIDSDEIVSVELSREIKVVIALDRAGYYLKRKDWMFGSWLNFGETSRVRLLRLAKKSTGIWRRPVHEVWDVKGDVGECREPIQHFPHSNVAQFIQEIDRYSTLNANYLFKRNIHEPTSHIIMYPLAKFFVDYFWYLGFLDGTAGAIIAIIMSFHSFLTRAKLYLLWRNEKREKTEI
jgi:glycosyltransferase involved in cell wall biosynthesis